MTRLLHPEFLEELDPTPYPFGDTSSLVSDTGYSLRGIFLDATFSIPGAGEGLRISRVEVLHEVIALFIADREQDNLARGWIYRHTPIDASGLLRKLVFHDIYDREVGLMISDEIRLASFFVWSDGVHRFEGSAAELATRCCQPDSGESVQGFLVDGELITGDVMIVGDHGIQLKSVQVIEPNPAVWERPNAPSHIQLGGIEIHAVGDPLFLRRCQGEFRTPRFLKELKVVAYPDETILVPDAFGNVEVRTTGHFEDDTILRVSGGLRFSVAGPSLEE